MNSFLLFLYIVIAPLLLIWGTGLSLAAAVRWLWRNRPLPPPDPDLHGPYGPGESFIVLFRRMTWEEIVSQLSGVTLSLVPPQVALAGMLVWGWPKWSIIPGIGLMLWLLWEYNARELGKTALPQEEERRFVVHPIGAAQPARRSGKSIPLAEVPPLLDQYAEVALCHTWQDNLLLWVQDQPIILRGVREIRQEKDNSWQVVAGRLCLPWNGIRTYSTAYYRQDAKHILRVFWMPDKFPYPDKETLRLDANAPLVTLSPQTAPADAPPTPATRFAPIDDERWAQHIAGKAFLIQAGSQTLSAGNAPQVRFCTAFERPGSWVGITEADDILLLDEIYRTEPTPEGGLTFVGRDGKRGPLLRVCLDSHGVAGSTECVVSNEMYQRSPEMYMRSYKVYLRFYSLTPTGAREGNVEKTPPRVTLTPVS